MTKASAVLLLVFAVSDVATAQCLLSFDAPRSADLPPNVYAVADFDGDGTIDLLADKGIYFHGSQYVALPRLVEDRPGSISDVNRDGRPDLLSGNTTELVTFINKGNASFTRKATLYSPRRIDASFVRGDYNGDGLLDVVVVGESVGPVRQLLLAVGDGTFVRGNDLTYDFTGKEGNYTWFRANVDGDGRDDLITVENAQTFTPRLVIYRGTENGFATRQLGVTVTPSPVLVADFNRDGRDDILFRPATGGADPWPLFFDALSPAARGSSMPAAAGYATADFNGDGAPDLMHLTDLQPNMPGGHLHLDLNDGRGNFQESQVLPGMHSYPQAVDLDANGIVDLLVDGYLIPGNGDGTFRFPVVPLAKTDSALAGDFDGDGDDDIVMSSSIAWNNGDNTFRVAAVSDPRLARLARAADVDGDGKVEVITLNHNVVLVLSLRPDGTIVEAANIPANASDAAVGYFTGSHRAELAVITGLSSGIEVKQGIAIYEIRNNAAPRFTVPFEGVPPTKRIAAADLNGDGVDEVLVIGGRLENVPFPGGGGYTTFSRDGFLSIFASTGTSFAPERRIAFPTSAFRDLVAGDFDADGKGDLAITSLIGYEINVLFGDAAAELSRRQTLVDGPSVRAADFNLDGRTDLAVNGTSFTIFLGSAAGLTKQASYYGKRSDLSLLIRPRRGTIPSVVVPLTYSADAFIYRPVCDPGRPRAVRH